MFAIEIIGGTFHGGIIDKMGKSQLTHYALFFSLLLQFKLAHIQNILKGCHNSSTYEQFTEHVYTILQV